MLTQMPWGRQQLAQPLNWELFSAGLVHRCNLRVPSWNKQSEQSCHFSKITVHSIHQHLQCLLINVTSSITYSTNLPWTTAMYNTESQSIEIQAGYLLAVREIRWELERSWMLLNVDRIQIQIQLLLTKVIVLSFKKTSTYASAYSNFFISELE